MSPGLVGGITVDRLTEQAEKQWEMQDHPGWDILEDDDACEASPVGPTGGRVQLSFQTLIVLQSLLHCLLANKRTHNTGPEGTMSWMFAEAVQSMILRHTVRSTWLFMGWCIIAF